MRSEAWVHLRRLTFSKDKEALEHKSTKVRPHEDPARGKLLWARRREAEETKPSYPMRWDLQFPSVPFQLVILRISS